MHLFEKERAYLKDARQKNPTEPSGAATTIAFLEKLIDFGWKYNNSVLSEREKLNQKQRSQIET